MKTFVLKLASLSVILVCLMTVLMIRRYHNFSKVDVGRDVQICKDTKYLFIGSSAIGCSIKEAEEYSNQTIWRSELPPQYTLMRLIDLQRAHKLADVKCLVFEFGHQSICQQAIDIQERLALETFSWSFRYLDLLPVSKMRLLCKFLFGKDCRLSTQEITRPDPGMDITQRDDEWIATDLERITRGYFVVPRNNSLMCDDWEMSLKHTIIAIKEICQRNNIKPIMLICPMCTYFRNAEPHDAKSKLTSFINFALLYGIQVIDARDWEEDMYFMNLNHLSAKGAGQFTLKFYKNMNWAVKR